MYAVFSITASDSPSLSFNISSWEKACHKFLSVELRYRVRESHVLNLLKVECMCVSNFCPLASLSVFEIIVASPLSCFAREVGDPVLALFSCSSMVKARHSDLISSDFSVITIPQLLQTTSPDSGSVIIPA